MNYADFKALTKIEESVFGLPFVLSGLLLPFADPGFVLTVTKNSIFHWFFIIPAFFAARVSGMAFNQLIDWKFDAINPRTSHRMLPRRKVLPMQAAFIAISALLLFFLFSFCISSLCFFVSVMVGSCLIVYSYMKRIHFSCHFFLGMIHFFAPVTAYLAITGRIDVRALLLGCVPLFSIAGSDIVYAMQDMHFDRKHRLHSIPSRFGLKKSLIFAAISHGLCFIFLILFGVFAQFPPFYFCAPCCAALSMLYFYNNTTSAKAFFFCNMGISISVFLFTLLVVLTGVY